MTPDEERTAVLIAIGDQALAELNGWTRRLRDLNERLADGHLLMEDEDD